MNKKCKIGLIVLGALVIIESVFIACICSMPYSKISPGFKKDIQEIREIQQDLMSELNQKDSIIATLQYKLDSVQHL